MPAHLFLITTGPVVLGATPSLNQAVTTAKLAARTCWADQAIWRDDELLGVVHAGGEYVPLLPAEWGIVSDIDDGMGDGYFPDEFPEFSEDAGPIVLLDAADMPLEDDVPW